MIEGLTPVVIDQFGGFCSLIGNRGDLPNGLAAVANDIEFFPGGMQSRGPFEDYLHTGLGAPVNSILSYPRYDGTKQRLLLLANGTLLYEYPEGTVATVDTSLGQNLIMRGTVMSNRAFVAFSDGKTPSGRPMHWDGGHLWFDPIGQDGPAWLITQGTGTNTGDATPGFHMSLATYTTRSGYETGPCTANYNTQMAGHAYSWTAVPIGPANVNFVRFYVSPVNDTSQFYSSSPLKTPDNSGANYDCPDSTTNPVTYTDSGLAGANTPLSHARTFAWPCPPCVGLEAYSGRLVAWGALNYQPRLSFSYGTDGGSGTALGLNYRSGFSNLQFDSGSVAGVPHGYGSMAAGGALATMAGAPTQCYKITGDGVSATRGQLVQTISPYRIFTYPPGTNWRMRIRAKKSSGASLGRLSVYTAGGATPIRVNVNTMTTEWAWYDALYFGATDTTSGMLYVQVDNGGSTGILQNNEWVAIDGMWMYPDTLPTLGSYLLISQPNDPETFDYVYGTLGVRPGDGQNITNCIELRGVLFVFKERSTFAVVDNSQSPSQWAPALMSDTVGCLSPHGVARGDGWLVTITQSGVYRMTGGAPEKLSQEIQPTWADPTTGVNWNYKHLSWAVADVDAQRVYIGVPTNGASYVNKVFVLDYAEGWGDPKASPGSGRRWSTWTPPASPGWPCAAYIERDNGTRSFVVGGGVAGVSGYVSKRDSTEWGGGTDTFGASTPYISSQYDTATLGQPTERSYYGYATAKIRGNGGGVTLSLVRPDNTILTQGTRNVSSTPLHDVEWQLAQTDTQLGLRFTNQNGGAFTIWRASAFIKPAAFAGVRGHNL